MGIEMSSFLPIALLPLVPPRCFHFARVLLQMRMAVPLSRRKRNRHSGCPPAHATLQMVPKLMPKRAPFGRTQGPNLKQKHKDASTSSPVASSGQRMLEAYSNFASTPTIVRNECWTVAKRCPTHTHTHQNVLNGSSGTQTSKRCSRAAPERRFAPDKWTVAPPALAEPLERPGSATSFETSSTKI